jgi:hypothetical protein
VAEAVAVLVKVKVFGGVFVYEGAAVAVLVAVGVRVLVDVAVNVLVAVRVGVVAGPQPVAATVFKAAGALIRTTSSIHRSKLYGAPVCPCVCHCIVSTLASAMALVTSVLPHPSCEKRMLAKSIDTFCHAVDAVNT